MADVGRVRRVIVAPFAELLFLDIIVLVATTQCRRCGLACLAELELHVGELRRKKIHPVTLCAEQLRVQPDSSSKVLQLRLQLSQLHHIAL